MTGSINKFAEIDTDIKGSVKFGDGSAVEIQGRGSVLFKCFTGAHRILTDVYYIPMLRSNIISLGQLDENGCKIMVEGGVMSILDRNRKLLIKESRSRNRLYMLHITPTHPECLLTRSKDEAWCWRARYGHVNFNSLKILSQKQMVHGLPKIEHEDRICDGFLIGKQRRNPFPTVTKFRAELPLELWHGDLCGPITPATHGGKRYFLLLVDDCTRFMWQVLIRSKDEAFEAFKKVKAAAEMEKNSKLKALRTDSGGEFTSNEFKQYCELMGIKRYLTAPYSPQQNGVVERRNQTVVGMARSLLKSMEVPGKFWGEEVSTAVYLLNRAPTKSVTGKTPYKAYHNHKPSIEHFRIFGCVGHVRDTKPHLSKLADRSKQMVFIGYDMNTKGYRMFDPVTRRVLVSRDVVFEEEKKWEWNKVPVTKTWAAGNTLSAQYFTVEGMFDTANQENEQSVSDSGIDIGNSGSDSPRTPEVNGGDLFESVQPEMNEESSSVGPRGKRDLSSLYDETSPIDLEYSGLCLLGEEEPSSYEVAKADLN